MWMRAKKTDTLRIRAVALRHRYPLEIPGSPWDVFFVQYKNFWFSMFRMGWEFCIFSKHLRRSWFKIPLDQVKLGPCSRYSTKGLPCFRVYFSHPSISQNFLSSPAVPGRNYANSIADTETPICFGPSHSLLGSFSIAYRRHGFNAYSKFKSLYLWGCLIAPVFLPSSHVRLGCYDRATIGLKL